MEAAHRRKMDECISGYIFKEKLSGVVAGVIVALVGMIISGYVILQGHDWAGTVLGGAQLVALVSIFVLKKLNIKSDDSENKAKTDAVIKKTPRTRTKSNPPSSN